MRYDWHCWAPNQYFNVPGKIKEGWQRFIRHSKIYKFCNLSNSANYRWEFKMPERMWVLIWPKESGKHCHRCPIFYDIVYSFHFWGKERLFALNEEGRSMRDLEPLLSEYLFGENMNKSLKLAKEDYKLSQNLVSTKSRNKVAGASSRTGFKLGPGQCHNQKKFGDTGFSWGSWGVLS